MALATVATIIGLTAKYGPTLALTIAAACNSEGEPTREDIEKLKDTIKEPRSYFNFEDKENE